MKLFTGFSWQVCPMECSLHGMLCYTEFYCHIYEQCHCLCLLPTCTASLPISCQSFCQAAAGWPGWVLCDKENFPAPEKWTPMPMHSNLIDVSSNAIITPNSQVDRTQLPVTAWPCATKFAYRLKGKAWLTDKSDRLTDSSSGLTTSSGRGHRRI